jgi:hypothetical protein
VERHFIQYLCDGGESFVHKAHSHDSGVKPFAGKGTQAARLSRLKTNANFSSSGFSAVLRARRISRADNIHKDVQWWQRKNAAEKLGCASEHWRRAHGIMPRRPAQKPWLAQGISRSTWYRRRAKAREQAALASTCTRAEAFVRQLQAELAEAARCQAVAAGIIGVAEKKHISSRPLENAVLPHRNEMAGLRLSKFPPRRLWPELEKGNSEGLRIDTQLPLPDVITHAPFA